MSPAHRGTFVAYYRVSTQKQGRSRLGHQAQKTAVLNYLEGRFWQVVREFTEIEPRKHHDTLPGLGKALAACKKHKAKLVIAQLDRVPTNVAFIAHLRELKVEFIAPYMPFANRVTIQPMFLFAEHEREIISSEIKAAL
jgi:DNA invertase Pin-like site-specific DNA recombinase